MNYLSLLVATTMFAATISSPAKATTGDHYGFNSRNAEFTSVDTKNLTSTQQRDLMCLSLNIYHEARGSTLPDKMGVAFVARNRSKIHDTTICEVVYERRWVSSRETWVSQFSWNTPGVLNRHLEHDAWDVSQKIAYGVLYNNLKDITHGATYFHEKNQQLGWDRGSYNRANLGSHVFFNLREDLSKTPRDSFTVAKSTMKRKMHNGEWVRTVANDAHRLAFEVKPQVKFAKA